MKHKAFIVLLILTCIMISACQGAGSSAPAATGGSSAENPSQSSAPSSTASFPSSSVPPTSSIPMGISELLADIKVIPENTYVNAHHPDGSENYENRIGIEREPGPTPFLYEIQLGEVRLSENIRKACEEYPANCVCYVIVSFSPTVHHYLDIGIIDSEDEEKRDAQIQELEDRVMALFEEAGYYVDNGVGPNQPNFGFYLYASLEQLMNLDCGDYLALYISPPKAGVW